MNKKTSKYYISNAEDKKFNEEEWGGWKIVSDMLDNPDENGIYPTSECYCRLYKFVKAQKAKALKDQKDYYEKELKAADDRWKANDYWRNEYFNLKNGI